MQMRGLVLFCDKVFNNGEVVTKESNPIENPFDSAINEAFSTWKLTLASLAEEPV